MKQECFVCGKRHRKEDEPEYYHECLCIYQPSLHTLTEFYEIAIDECRHAGVSGVEYNPKDLHLYGEEILNEFENELPKGIVAISDTDYWALWTL